MKVEVILSCMYENVCELIKKSNLNDVNTLVVNQCNVEKDDLTSISERHRVLNTSTRGLSVSRNMAIENSIGDICVISDDDERFVDDLEKIVEKAYNDIPEADIIIFKVKNKNKLYGSKMRKLYKYELLKVASWMITFKKSSVSHTVKFNELMGAGTLNGGGEENKFLFDCYNHGLKIYYVPIEIAEFRDGMDSTWFKGYTEDYFFKLGVVIKSILGLGIGFMYILYTALKQYNNYHNEISFIKALSNMIKGFFTGKLEEKNAAKI